MTEVLEERQRHLRTEKDVGGQTEMDNGVGGERHWQTETLEEREAWEDGQKNLRTDRYWRIDRGIEEWTESLEDGERH